MKIDRATSARASTLRRSDRSGGVKSGDFAKALAEEASPLVVADESGSVGPIDGILAIQEIPDALAHRNREFQRGEALLDQLGELRMDLLSGNLPKVRLERIAMMVAAKRGQIDDPRLIEILNEIEVRAVVELAKLGK